MIMSGLYPLKERSEIRLEEHPADAFVVEEESPVTREPLQEQFVILFTLMPNKAAVLYHQVFLTFFTSPLG